MSDRPVHPRPRRRAYASCTTTSPHYKLDGNRLDGDATFVRRERDLTGFTLDLAGLRVARCTVDGRRRQVHPRGGRLSDVTAPLAAGQEFGVRVQYSGTRGRCPRRPSATPAGRS